MKQVHKNSKTRNKKSPQWRTWYGIALIIILGNLIFLGTIFTRNIYPRLFPPETESQKLLKRYPELKEFENKNLSASDTSHFFQSLAYQKGAAYAYDVLRVAPLPSNIDVHLLGHTVGDVLYKQQGIKGMTICTQDFRNACSHSIVVGELLKHGLSSLPKIAAVCKKAPGGKNGYDMCYHGLGHGVLAYTQYDMGKAVSLCQTLGIPSHYEAEYSECVGGVTMEMMSGIHDPAAWVRQKANYLSATDPLAPCSTDVIPNEVKEMCYIYLTPHLFEAAGANIQYPLPEDFRAAFRFCDAVPNTADRNSCYGGFGKEFIVLAQNRDIRAIDTMTSKQFTQVHHWCDFAENKPGTEACIQTALNSVYWGGDNEVQTSIRFCNAASTTDHKSWCYQSLTDDVAYFKSDKSYRQTYCSQVDSVAKQYCQKKLDV